MAVLLRLTQERMDIACQVTIPWYGWRCSSELHREVEYKSALCNDPLLRMAVLLSSSMPVRSKERERVPIPWYGWRCSSGIFTTYGHEHATSVPIPCAGWQCAAAL